MKTITPKTALHIACSLALATLLGGCASNAPSQTSSPPAPQSGGNGQVASKYKAPDGRTIEIGKRTPAEGGWSYKDPHLDKCWVADGFDFNGYDALYIAPTLSTAKLHNEKEEYPHDLAKRNLSIELE